MEHGAYYMRGSWGQLKSVSNDKGPHKIATVECDGKPIDCHVGESFGVQANPHTDALCYVVFPDGDEGKGLIIFALPRPKDRWDQQKEGEVGVKNFDKGQYMHLDANGHIVMSTPNGEIHLN